MLPTCSGLRPGGTQAYSSRAHPESSSDVELLWHPKASLLILGSISKGIIMRFKTLASQSQDIQRQWLWVTQGNIKCKKKKILYQELLVSRVYTSMGCSEKVTKRLELLTSNN